MSNIVLVGGCGFVGIALANAFLRDGRIVNIVDISPLPKELEGKVTYFHGDSSDASTMDLAFKQVRPEAVIHLASYGMSGSPMLSSKCRQINVRGAECTIQSCLRNNVSVLIYTSTYNVVFGGKPIENGNEDLDYFPIEEHTDQYSPSKALAEQLVLQANGRKTSSGAPLRTGVIRPAAIYGEKEQRHFPRLLKHIDSGIFQFRIGNATVDWVHVENLVLAFHLMLNKLCDLSKTSSSSLSSNVTVPPSGQAYFISDGSPVNSFEFLRPLCEARGCVLPNLTLPMRLLEVVAFGCESLYTVSQWLGHPIEPFLTRAEVYKVGVTHYCSIEKARKELGYKPIFNTIVGADRVARYYGSLLNSEHFFRPVAPMWYILILAGMFLTAALGYQWFPISNTAILSQVGDSVASRCYHNLLLGFWYLEQLALFLFRSHFGIRLVFWAAVATHVYEAFLSWQMTRRLGCSAYRWLWVAQTLLLGFPSLSLLHSREKFIEERKV